MFIFHSGKLIHKIYSIRWLLGDLKVVKCGDQEMEYESAIFCYKPCVRLYDHR